MNEYEFTLRFDVSAVRGSMEHFVEALGDQGCDDATVGVGIPGRLALMFTREADTADDAVLSAVRDVVRALPGAKLTEAAPDYVGITEVAEIVGKTRQNMRKLLLISQGNAPSAAHEGASSIWHLAPVLEWLRDEKQYAIDQTMLDVATTNMELNAAALRVEISSRVINELESLQG